MKVLSINYELHSRGSKYLFPCIVRLCTCLINLFFIQHCCNNAKLKIQLSIIYLKLLVMIYNIKFKIV